MDVMDMFRKKFEDYRRLVDEKDEQHARTVLMEGYPERQKKNMGPFFEGCTLYEGFKKAAPVYGSFGMEMHPVDVSNQGRDAALEVHVKCPFMDMAREFGFDRPCAVICELDQDAMALAFEGLDVKILTTMADGDTSCIFLYQRDK
jgi:predicted ArsR family transcriptional regulator